MTAYESIDPFVHSFLGRMGVFCAADCPQFDLFPDVKCSRSEKADLGRRYFGDRVERVWWGQSFHRASRTENSILGSGQGDSRTISSLISTTLDGIAFSP